MHVSVCVQTLLQHGTRSSIYCTYMLYNCDKGYVKLCMELHKRRHSIVISLPRALSVYTYTGDRTRSHPKERLDV